MNEYCFNLIIDAIPTSQAATGGLGTGPVIGVTAAAFILGVVVAVVGVIVILRRVTG